MARRAKDDGEQPQQTGKRGATGAAPAGHNVTDETIAEHMKKVMAARSEMQDVQEQLDEARGVYRACLKAAKKSGVDPDAITAALKMMDGDHDDIRVRSQMTRRILKVSGSPLALVYAEQPDLFDAAGPKQAHVTGSDDTAYADGYNKGKAGGNINANPHARTATAHAAWNRGWHQAQADLAEELGAKHDGAPGPLGAVKFRRPDAAATPPAA